MKILEEMVRQQRLKLLQVAKRIVVHVTSDDLLQPQDYPALELSPEFRYEEGILHGLESALFALRAP